MDRADPDIDLLAPTPLDRLRQWLGPPRRYAITRSVLLRLLGVIYLFAFLGLTRQVLPLLGSHGLTPAADLLAAEDHPWGLPTLFWIDCSDTSLVLLSWIGVVLALVVVAGFGNAPVLALLWLIYGSFVRVGDFWFGFGWEIQLLETGFLAIFLAPPLDPRPRCARPPPVIVIVLLRWLTFRIMLGAGLIKMRGDDCWTHLTCLDHHFETQPLPNPLSPWFHRMPHAVHAGGVLFNHLCELVAPWFVFGPRPARLVAAALMIAFQLMLIVSGNLSFLNWLTLVPIVACLDDDALLRLVPARARAWSARRGEGSPDCPSRGQSIAAGLLAALVTLFSLDVIANLASSHQAMNRAYDRFALVNTYGAFGSVGDTRYELVIEGTADEDPGDDADWRAYQLPCQPGPLDRRPCVLGPYHHRLDWLIWFAAMDERWTGSRWMVHVVWKLLHGDRGLRSLFDVDPFPDAPPRWIRIRRFVYRFAPAGSDDWWVREEVGEWLPPVGPDEDDLRAVLEPFGWPTPIDL